MLDDYQNKQPIAYKIFKNAIKKDKYSHAYLFETAGYPDSFNLILSFVKSIICPNNYTNNHNCNNCHKCDAIESGNHPEIKIINPDGLWIKKEQLNELQEEFKNKAIIGTKKIYIINQADRLNIQAANSILKFLEEPEEGIIAILITENIYQILETIRSRCQIIKLKEEKYDFNEIDTIRRISKILNIEITESKELQIQKVINFTNQYEKLHYDTILYMQKLWHDHIKTKEDQIMGFDIMIMYYKDVLNRLLGHEIEIFIDYSDDIDKIISTNDIRTIISKLAIITEFKEKIKYNANQNLLMDKLTIALEGGVKW